MFDIKGPLTNFEKKGKKLQRDFYGRTWKHEFSRCIWEAEVASNFLHEMKESRVEYEARCWSAAEMCCDHRIVAVWQLAYGKDNGTKVVGECHLKGKTDKKMILIVVSDKRKQSGNEASPRSAVEPNSCEPAGISLASKWNSTDTFTRKTWIKQQQPPSVFVSYLYL